MNKENWYSKIGMAPAFMNNNIPVFMTVSNEYFKYFCVLLNSIIRHSSQHNNYDIIVIVDEEISSISLEKLEFLLQGHSNFSVRFFNISELAKGWEPYLRGSYRINSYYRLLAPYFMTKYDKSLYLDIDTIVLADLANLYNIDIGNSFLGATSDIAAEGFYLDGQREDLVFDLNNNVGVQSINKYFQCAILIVNLLKFRKTYSISQIKSIASMKEWMYIDQDVYNFVAKNKVYFLDYKWNVTATTVVGRGLELASKKSYNNYLQSRRSPYIIHYPGEKKPWIFPNSDFAYAFWDNAKGSPFYEELMIDVLLNAKNTSPQGNDNRSINKSSNNVVTTKRSPKATSGNLIFRCVTLYHLFNAINLKLQKYPNRKAGVILCEGTDWGDIPNILFKLKVFDKVLVSNTPRLLDKYFAVDKMERYSSVKDPVNSYLKYGGDPSELAFCKELEPITDMFVALNYHFEKYLYYCLITTTSTIPQIHIYEEGSASYVLNYWSGSVNDGLDHKSYKQNAYGNNISELLVYEPKMVTMNNAPFQVVSLPKISQHNRKIQAIMENIFGSIQLPDEKFIYFDCPDIADGYVSTGIDFLDELAKFIGKDNIVVKLHPRNTINRYSIRGYKTIPADCRLWEMAYYNPAVKDKIFISELSTATMTAKTVFGIDIKSINLFRLLLFPKKNFLLSKESFDEFYEKYLKISNIDGNMIFTPKTKEELIEIALFINADLGEKHE